MRLALCVLWKSAVALLLWYVVSALKIHNTRIFQNTSDITALYMAMPR